MTVTVAAKTETFTNNTANDAVPVNSEFAAAFNNDALLATEINLIGSSAYTFIGTKTFDGLMRWSQGTTTIAAGVITPTKMVQYVRTEAAAATDDLVTITQNGAGQILILRGYDAAEVVTLKHGTGNVYLLNNADYVFSDVENYLALFYDSNAGHWNELFRTNPSAIIPKGNIGGPTPYYNNAASWIFPAGLYAMDSTNAVLMTLSGNITCSLATSGAAGLDTGAEASNTHYYPYLIAKADGTTSVVWSVTNESVSGSITLPSGYVYKRQLKMSVRNDGSSNIIPSDILNWPYAPFIKYMTPMSNHSGGATTAGTTNVLSAGTSAAYASVACSSFIPPISTVGQFNALSTFANAAYATLRSASGFLEIMCAGPAGTATVVDCGTTSGQAIEYKRAAGTGSVNLDVTGYHVTEL